jgi:hypothetical protein
MIYFLYLYLGVFGVIEVDYHFKSETACNVAGAMNVTKWRESRPAKWSASTYYCVGVPDDKTEAEK